MRAQQSLLKCIERSTRIRHSAIDTSESKHCRTRWVDLGRCHSRRRSEDRVTRTYSRTAKKEKANPVKIAFHYHPDLVFQTYEWRKSKSHPWWSNTEGILTKRPRVDVTALLSSGITDEPLKPEDDLTKYDRERLQWGLSYVNRAAQTQRKITSRTQKLRKTLDAYKAVLKEDFSNRCWSHLIRESLEVHSLKAISENFASSHLCPFL